MQSYTVLYRDCSGFLLGSSMAVTSPCWLRSIMCQLIAAERLFLLMCSIYVYGVASIVGSSLQNCLRLRPCSTLPQRLLKRYRGTSGTISCCAASFSGFLCNVINGGFPPRAGASLKVSVFHDAKQLFTVNFAYCSVFALPEVAVILGCCVTFLRLLRVMSSKWYVSFTISSSHARRLSLRI